MTDLKRSLRLMDGLAMVVGIMVGSGIFRTPGLVAARLGRPWLTLVAWFLGGALALFGDLGVVIQDDRRHQHQVSLARRARKHRKAAVLRAPGNRRCREIRWLQQRNELAISDFEQDVRPDHGCRNDFVLVGGGWGGVAHLE